MRGWPLPQCLMKRRTPQSSMLRGAAGSDHADTANQVLLDAARLLSTSLELDDTLDQVMRLAVPRLADYSLLYLRTPDGTYRQEASAHVDPAKSALLAELGRIYEPDLHNPNSRVGGVLVSRRPFLAPVTSLDASRQFSADPAAQRIYNELDPVSYLIIPLVAHDELLGSLVFVMSVSGRRYEVADLELAELVGARAALAIDNARLYRAARDAHRRESGSCPKPGHRKQTAVSDPLRTESR